ncbi:MAG TPA: hypothetical protein VGR19_07400 [Allosphingosinicella sp.]|nr:hypothetical protein [Allosphingosinicella sp.]
MKKHLSAGAALTVVAAAAVSFPALAGHGWNNYHWSRTGAAITPPVGDNVDAKWDPYFQRVLDDWNRSDFINSALAAGLTNPKNCKAVAGTIQVCNSKYGQTGWLGIAQIWLSNGHITQGITKLNDTYFDTAKYNTPAWRRMVFCQEVGHDYGLGHVNENFDDPNTGSCMDYTNDPARNDGQGTNEYTNQHDYDQLALIYGGHSEGTAGTTAVQSGQRSAGISAEDSVGGDTPAQWGRAIHRDGYGRPDVFQLDLPGGGKKITHVFWTLEHNRSGA